MMKQARLSAEGHSNDVGARIAKKNNKDILAEYEIRQ